MDLPEGWIVMNNDEVVKNLNKYDLTDEQLKRILKSNSAAVNISSYTKYNPKKHLGIIPTIKINTISNPTKSSSDFLKYVNASSENGKKTLDNFEFAEKPCLVKISNQDVVKFSIKFTLKNAGAVYEILSKSYYIPKDGYYISLNFIEQIGKEDNEKFFEKLIQSIQLTK